MATKNFIEELEWRGMIHTIMPGAKEQLEKEQTTAYLGIDPTADSLHIGHLVGVMILKHFQMCGHRPLALVGGATGMIGDPSGKSQERNLLDEKTLRHNQEAIKRQLAKLLDFDSDAPNAAALVNNYDLDTRATPAAAHFPCAMADSKPPMAMGRQAAKNISPSLPVNTRSSPEKKPSFIKAKNQATSPYRPWVPGMICKIRI